MAKSWITATSFSEVAAVPLQAANRVGGHVSCRLDWFAGNGISLTPNTKPQTVGNLPDSENVPLSDHDAITVDFTLRRSL